MHSGLPDVFAGGNRMYKYSFQGQIHTAQDFFEARNRAGLPLQDTHPSVSHYLVRLWQWDDAEKDYAVEIFNTPGHQIFNVYDEAMVCYNTLAEFFPDEITNDTKLELVHVHQGEIHELAATILYPPVDAWQW